jgi:hypothetical protein
MGRAEDDAEVDPGADAFPGEPPIPLSRSDMILVRRAAKGRWPIPEAFRRRILARVGSIVASDLTGTRNVIAAGKLLKELDGLNMEQEKRDLGITEKHEVRVTSPTLDQAANELARWREEMTASLSNTPSAPPMRPILPITTG